MLAAHTAPFYDSGYGLGDRRHVSVDPAGLALLLLWPVLTSDPDDLLRRYEFVR